MGVYDIRSELKSAIESNLATKIGVVETAKSKTLDDSFTFYNRERAETFYNKTLPGVGLWMRTISTGAVRSRNRRWEATAVIDYLYRGSKKDTVGEQVELVLDAMMRVIDDLAGTGTIEGAGEEPFATTPIDDIYDLLQESGEVGGPYISGFRLEVPITQLDDLQ